VELILGKVNNVAILSWIEIRLTSRNPSNWAQTEKQFNLVNEVTKLCIETQMKALFGHLENFTPAALERHGDSCYPRHWLPGGRHWLPQHWLPDTGYP
jgi:hypothetical protein